MLGAERLTHWSIPVRDLADSIVFYRDFLGLEYTGPLGGPGSPRQAAVFRAADAPFILWQTGLDADPRLAEAGVHYAFTVTPEIWDRAILAAHEAGVGLQRPIVYRSEGHFTGRELYLFDPSGNTIELTDPNWVKGMPEPAFEGIVAAALPR